MSQQLVKKGANGKYSNVNPKSWTEAIKDKNTGQTLVEILQGFNMYFLSYTGDKESTRCLVPNILRKKGLWITYVDYDNIVHTEWYAANSIEDDSWKNNSNWRVGSNKLVGDISISSNGNWVINGKETSYKAIGERGYTPILRVGSDNKLQVSYDEGYTYSNVSEDNVFTQFKIIDNKLNSSTDLGKTWNPVSDYIASWIRWQATIGDTQANNVGRIQISKDNKTWTNLSNDISNNLHISKYIGADEPLPTIGIAEGTIYAKGPTYAEDDTLNENPIYRLWVYAWKGNTLAWQDNGEFQSIAAGVVQETGDSETEVMSQKAVTDKLSELGSNVRVNFNFGGIDFVNGKIDVNDIRIYSDEIKLQGNDTVKSIRINKPEGLFIPYSSSRQRYPIFGYKNGEYVNSNLNARVYEDSIRVDLEGIDIDTIRIVLGKSDDAVITESEKDKTSAYLDLEYAVSNSCVPFRYGAVDPSTGVLYYNGYKNRIMTQPLYINKPKDGRAFFVKLNMPLGLKPAVFNGRFLVYAFNGNTPVSSPGYSILDDNNVAFNAADNFDNIIITCAKSDNSDITEEEMKQCYAEVYYSLKNQIKQNSIDIEKLERNIRMDIPVNAMPIKFMYGSVSTNDGSYSNNYGGEYDINKIRARSVPILTGIGPNRLEIANNGSLVISAVVAYKGINFVKKLDVSTSYKTFAVFENDGSFDRVILVLKKEGDAEIAEEEISSVVAYGSLLNTKPMSKYGGLKYCALGDSITYGYIPRNAQGHPGQLPSYARIAAEKLGMNFLNYGISGSTVANVENAMSTRYANMPSDADIITVMGGTNDKNRGVPLGNMSDRTNNTFYGALHVLYQGLYDKYIGKASPSAGCKKKIIVITPIKRLDKEKASLPNTVGNNSDALLKWDEWIEAIKEVAAYYSFPVLDMYNLSQINPHINRVLVGTTEGYTGNYNPLIPDGTHPSEEGHRMMADLLVGYIKNLIS